MSTPKKQVVAEKPTSNGQETKKGAEVAAATLTPNAEEKTEPEPPAKVEPAAIAPEPKPSAEQILKRLPLLNDLRERLLALDVRNDQLLSAQTRRTGNGETLTIKFAQGDPIIVSNPFGIAKCLDALVEENEKLIVKTKAEIESFTF